MRPGPRLLLQYRVNRADRNPRHLTDAADRPPAVMAHSQYLLQSCHCDSPSAHRVRLPRSRWQIKSAIDTNKTMKLQIALPKTVPETPDTGPRVSYD